MKRCLSTTLFCLLFMVCGFMVPPAAPAADSKTVGEITFLTWADYMDPGLIEKFEKENHIKVRLVTFDSDDGRTRMLISTEGEDFDVAVMDGNSMEAYISRSWLLPVSESSVPNLSRIDSKWRNAYPGAESHGVPYFWGTTGIAYRTDLVSEPITSWMQMFKPAPDLQGKLYMLPQNRELLDIALKALGHSLNTTDKNAYRQARDLLLQQKPFVKKYDFLALNEDSGMIDGTVCAAVTYNGDALTLRDINSNITYVTPKEGGVLWVDYLVILAKSHNPRLAETFINFLHEPENAAQLAQFVQYATPNRDAEKLLPKAFLTDTIIYPPPEILEKYELDHKLPAPIQKIRSSIFAEVTSGKI